MNFKSFNTLFGCRNRFKKIMNFKSIVKHSLEEKYDFSFSDR